MNHRNMIQQITNRKSKIIAWSQALCEGLYLVWGTTELSDIKVVIKDLQEAIRSLAAVCLWSQRNLESRAMGEDFPAIFQLQPGLCKHTCPSTIQFSPHITSSREHPRRPDLAHCYITSAMYHFSEKE